MSQSPPDHPERLLRFHVRSQQQKNLLPRNGVQTLMVTSIVNRPYHSQETQKFLLTPLIYTWQHPINMSATEKQVSLAFAASKDRWFRGTQLLAVTTQTFSSILQERP